MIVTLATADVLPAELVDRLAAAALAAGLSPALVAPLFGGGPGEVCRVATDLAARLLASSPASAPGEPRCR